MAKSIDKSSYFGDKDLDLLEKKAKGYGVKSTISATMSFLSGAFSLAALAEKIFDFTAMSPSYVMIATSAILWLFTLLSKTYYSHMKKDTLYEIESALTIN